MKKARLFLTGCMAAFMCAGCNPMRISQIPPLQESDWPQYGGTIERINTAHFQLHPPLTRVWDYDGNAGFSPEAVVSEGGFLFISNLQGEVHILDLKEGKKIASHHFGSAIYGSPVIDGSMIYVALSKEEESLCAFDLSSGNLSWKALLGGVESSPLLVGDRLYVVSLKGELTCLNKQIGTKVWIFKNPDEENVALCHSSPVSDGRSIIYSRDDGTMFAINAETGLLLWRSKIRKAIVATPSIADGMVLVGSLDSCFYALDVSTGNQRWKQNLDGRIFASQAIANGYVYVGTGNGTMYCLKNGTGGITWNYKTEGAISSAPLISGGIVYSGSLDKKLYAFDGANGNVLWSWKSDGRIKTTPLIHEGFLIVLDDNRTVTAFKEGENNQ